MHKRIQLQFFDLFFTPAILSGMEKTLNTDLDQWKNQTINTAANDMQHKVRTFKEYHSVFPSSELGLSQPISGQRVFPSPQKQGGGGTLACGWGGWGEKRQDKR